MSFLNIPDKVVTAKILPCLTWNDLLRLRRVCTLIHRVVSAYFRGHPEKAPELEINEVGRNLDSFLKMDIPTCKLFLNIHGEDFFLANKEGVAKFLTKCGSSIIELRVTKISTYISSEAWDFYSGLINLKTFQAEYFGYLGTGESFDEIVMEVEKLKQLDAMRKIRLKNGNDHALPLNFVQLECLNIGNGSNLQCSIQSTDDPIHFLVVGMNLKEITLPLDSSKDVSEARALQFTFMSDLIPKQNLKRIDFLHCYDELDDRTHQLKAIDSFVFEDIVTESALYNVKIHNVVATWFLGYEHLSNTKFGLLDTSIVSLINIHKCVFAMKMPLLEKLDIRSLAQSCVGHKWNYRPEWEHLKELLIKVDSTNTHCSKIIYSFLFKDILRQRLTELTLTFPESLQEYPIPKASDVISTCPNLRKLCIENWPGTNKYLIKLWDSLTNLEEISLTKCKNVGNVTFVGLDTQNPVLFKLKNLKKLTLGGLDQMPKITDLLFTLVLRHLKLTHLIITSSKPVKTVTKAGIFALAEGCFAETIEKFPFEGWSLDKVSSNSFRSLGRKFRSFNFI